jgi:hypothetical protein
MDVQIKKSVRKFFIAIGTVKNHVYNISLKSVKYLQGKKYGSYTIITKIKFRIFLKQRYVG